VHEKSLQTLELPKVLAAVAEQASFSMGRERVLALRPASTLDDARSRLAFTTEAVRLADEQPRAGLRGAHDVSSQLDRASRQGTLSAGDLVLVASTLRAARSVAHLLRGLDSDQFKQMQALGEGMPVHQELIHRLEEIVDDEGQVLDSASPRLRRLRMEVGAAHQRLQQRLRTLVAEFGSALQEPIVTTRGDRWVVPVKADFRGRVKGLVHDQSSSGATLFIEPMAIVELGNKLREAESQEKEEIDRILAEVSHEIGRDAPGIGQAMVAMAEFDLQVAKARYSREHRCTSPNMNSEGRILLRGARHPLLTGRVVPVDFHLGQEFFMVVVTGPNTGGKTVALKSVGLLTLMAQSGLHVPAEDGAELAVFDDVFADIGDEQSIEQSLSTFSSHMTRIIEVLRSVEAARRRHPDRSEGQLAPLLVLLDELGAGTDPDEGSALARSILTYLLDRRVPTVATTHYSELKAFAHERAGVVNASVAFDVETLSPTYELEIGLPGRSNALAIAARLGLDARIVRGARGHLGTTGVRMEGLLRDLEKEREAAAAERRQLGHEVAEATRRREDLEAARHLVEVDRARILDEARAQARRELDLVLAELAQVRARSRAPDLTRAGIDQLRRRARKVEDSLPPLSQPARPPRAADKVGAEALAGPVQVGDSVRVAALDQTGEVLGLSADGDEAEVQIGPMRLRTGTSGLQRLRPRPARDGDDGGAVRVVRAADRAPISYQLDMRGARVEDALDDLESYLNDAVMSGLSSVRILHGKGTGALRTAVRERLIGHPLVRSAVAAAANDGGEGVTIVQLGD
jgi:DNA mismatch repair protein MutS2